MEETRGRVPGCCGGEMVLLRSGRCANFALWLWRGAMGRAIAAKQGELVGDAYAAAEPPG